MWKVKCNSSYHFSAEILHCIVFTIFLMAPNVLFFLKFFYSTSSCWSIPNIVIFRQSLYFHIFYCINLVYPAVTDGNCSPIWCRTCTAGSRSYFCSSVRTSLQTRHSASPPTERLEIEWTSTTRCGTGHRIQATCTPGLGPGNTEIIRYCALSIKLCSKAPDDISDAF